MSFDRFLTQITPHFPKGRLLSQHSGIIFNSILQLLDRQSKARPKKTI